MTTATSYTPSMVGQAVDTLASILAFPSNLVEGKASKARILTTKYIFIQHYVDAPPELEKLAREATARNWSTVRRVIWAVTIVLPLLDTLAAMIRSCAKLDYAIRVRYANEAYRERHIALKHTQDAVKKSIREFAGFLLIISGKEKNSSYQGAPERTADEQYTRFCSHFKDNDPKKQVIEACKSIKELLDRAYPQKRQCAQALCTAFHEVEEHLAKNGSCDWMKGASDSPLSNAFQAIVTNYEPFYNQA